MGKLLITGLILSSFFMTLAWGKDDKKVDMADKAEKTNFGDSVSLVTECSKNIKSLSDFFNAQYLVCPATDIDGTTSESLTSILNISVGNMSAADKKFISDISILLPAEKVPLQNTIINMAKKDKDVQDALDFLQSNNVPWKMSDSNSNSHCGAGTAFAYPSVDPGGMRVEICAKNYNWPDLKEALLHEVLHIKQYLGASKDHKCTGNDHGNAYELSIHKKYESHMSLHPVKEDDMPMTSLKDKALEEIVNDSFGIEKYFYIDYSGSKFGLTPKKPNDVTTEQFYSDLENKFNKLKSKTGMFGMEITNPKMAAAIKNIPHTSGRDLLEKYTTTLNERLMNLKADSKPEEVEKFDKYIDLFLVGRNRIIPQLKSFCIEAQAYINDINTKNINFNRLKTLVPSCKNDSPYFSKQSVSSDASPVEYEAEIEKIALQNFKRSSIYSDQFSEMYGMNDFKEIFNPKNCSNPPSELFRFQP